MSEALSTRFVAIREDVMTTRITRRDWTSTSIQHADILPVTTDAVFCFAGVLIRHLKQYQRCHTD